MYWFFSYGSYRLQMAEWWWYVSETWVSKQLLPKLIADYWWLITDNSQAKSGEPWAMSHLTVLTVYRRLITDFYFFIRLSGLQAVREVTFPGEKVVFIILKWFPTVLPEMRHKTVSCLQSKWNIIWGWLIMILVLLLADSIKHISPSV